MDGGWICWQEWCWRTGTKHDWQVSSWENMVSCHSGGLVNRDYSDIKRYWPWIYAWGGDGLKQTAWWGQDGACWGRGDLLSVSPAHGWPTPCVRAGGWGPPPGPSTKSPATCKYLSNKCRFIQCLSMLRISDLQQMSGWSVLNLMRGGHWWVVHRMGTAPCFGSWLVLNSGIEVGKRRQLGKGFPILGNFNLF